MVHLEKVKVDECSCKGCYFENYSHCPDTEACIQGHYIWKPSKEENDD